MESKKTERYRARHGGLTLDVAIVTEDEVIAKSSHGDLPASYGDLVARLPDGNLFIIDNKTIQRNMETTGEYGEPILFEEVSERKKVCPVCDKEMVNWSEDGSELDEYGDVDIAMIDYDEGRWPGEDDVLRIGTVCEPCYNLIKAFIRNGGLLKEIRKRS